MFTRISVAVATFAAASAFALPMWFPHAVDGCSDPSYKFNHSGVGAPNEEDAQLRADFAKQQFCDAAARA